jgi:zinc-binding in reverse transcriptase
MMLFDFNALCAYIQNTQLTIGSDEVVWRWKGNGQFSTHSAYEWLVCKGMTQEFCYLWWNLNIPLKIKVFMWLINKKNIY